MEELPLLPSEPPSTRPPPPPAKEHRDPGWVNLSFIAAGLAGMAWCSPVLRQLKSSDPDLSLTGTTVLQGIGFLLSMILVAAMLGIRLTHWLAGRVTDLIFDPNLRMPVPLPGEAPKPVKIRHDDPESPLKAWRPWLLAALSLGTMALLWPAIHQWRHLPEDTLPSRALIAKTVAFIAALGLFAGVAGVRLVPWAVDAFVDALFGDRGGHLPPPKEGREKSPGHR